MNRKTLLFISGISLFSCVGLAAARTELLPGEMVSAEAVTYRREGYMLQQQGDLRRAMAAYRMALFLHPTYGEVYNDMGVILEAMGDKVRAEQAYKMSLHFRPDLGQPHSNLASLYEDEGKIPEAVEHWTTRVRLGPPEDPWVWKAREKLKQYNQTVPKSIQVELQQAVNTGLTQMRAKHWQRAYLEFEKALHLDPKNKLAARMMAKAARRWPGVARYRAGEGVAERDTLLRQSKQGRAILKREKVAQARQKQLLRKVGKKNRAKESAFRRAEVLRRAEANRRSREADLAMRRADEAKRRAFEAQRRSASARRASYAAKVSSLREAAEEEAGFKEEPVIRPQRMEKAPANAKALAQQIAKEKAQNRGLTRKELYSRGLLALRQGRYEEAAEQFRQMLVLNPADQEAKQSLERAEKALAKAQQTAGTTAR